jgi:hypothetical protein
MRVLILLLLTSSLAAENPWGVDADLAEHKPQYREINEDCPTPILGTLAEGLIKFHQDVISPADGPRSHYIPSSSQYTLLAMRKYGFYRGFMMGCDRLMRENNETWVYRTTIDGADNLIKWDPLP